MLTTEQKILGLLSHLGLFIGFPILAPLLIMLLSNDYICKNQAKEALVFQLGLIVLGSIGGLLTIILIGFPILLVAGILGIVFPIIAAVKFMQDGDYSYPVTGNFARSL